MPTATPTENPAVIPLEPTSGSPDPSWVLFRDLRAEGAVRHTALGQLHSLLLRGARHELGRKGDLLYGVSRVQVDDLAHQAAGDAMAAILAKLETFRGESRFSTWAYKFVILEAGVKARRRAWRDREVNLDDESWRRIGNSEDSPHRSVEMSDLLRGITTAIATGLTPHQREIFLALAVNEVPIDVLAERLETTRGALYKTLHDARKKLRATLADAGFDLDEQKGGSR